MKDDGYKEAYCTRVVNLMETGYTESRVASEIGVSKRKLNGWRKTYPDFDEAMEYGLTKLQAYMEDIGVRGMKGAYTKFNAAAWDKFMRCNFKDTYKEINKSELQITDPTKDMSDVEIDDAISFLLAKKAINQYGGSGAPAEVE